MEKILLKEDKKGAENAIAAINKGYADGLNLLKKLSVLGLELTEVKDWKKEVEPHFKQQFPDASLDFNLEANGTKVLYFEAEQLFKTASNLFFVKPTTEEIEAIQEHYKVYAETDNQIEAFNLVHTVAKDLNRLKELGIPVNTFDISNVCPVLVNGTGGVTEVYNRNLIEFVQGLK